MKVFEGSSTKGRAQEAILEAINHWDDGFSPSILFVFHSTTQDPHDIAEKLTKHFPNTTIVGATTSGEWISGQHKNDALVLLGMLTPEIRWSMSVVEDLNVSPDQVIKQTLDELMQQLNIKWNDLNATKHFCLSFFDGMSCREEPFIAAMSKELGDISLLGGSAGDDLKFKGTYVIANGKAYQNAAVFILAESKTSFHAIKHQHFVPGDIDVVITKADVDRRLVYRLDGMPAAQRYAQLMGLEVGELTPQIFSDNPLIYPYGNECYVRALRRVCEEGSLEFGCAIEEGMILNLCKHQGMTQEYDKLMLELKQNLGEVKVLLVYNCIYRALEGKYADINQTLAERTSAITEHMIGFDTYGEQWQGLHMNQTLVALALGSK